jgi:hypothetical protein
MEKDMKKQQVRLGLPAPEIVLVELKPPSSPGGVHVTPEHRHTTLYSPGTWVNPDSLQKKPRHSLGSLQLQTTSRVQNSVELFILA